MEDMIIMSLVKALAKKQMSYELDGYEGDFDVDVESPLLSDETVMKCKMKGTMKLNHCTFTITNSTKDETEYGL